MKWYSQPFYWNKTLLRGFKSLLYRYLFIFFIVRCIVIWTGKEKRAKIFLRNKVHCITSYICILAGWASAYAPYLKHKNLVAYDICWLHHFYQVQCAKSKYSETVKLIILENIQKKKNHVIYTEKHSTAMRSMKLFSRCLNKNHMYTT